jgi:hypothetical protein
MKVKSINISRVKKDKKSKAQAMVELAILGPLLLMAVGFVATFVCKLNNDQYELQKAFRFALQGAHDTNKILSVGTWDDRRMVDINLPIIGQKTTSSGSAAVAWSIEDVTGEGAEPGSDTYVKINMPPPVKLNPKLTKGSGGIEPFYFTGKSSGVSINTVNNHISSSHSAGVGEGMIYKMNKQFVGQGRGSGGSRSYSATLSGGD